MRSRALVLALIALAVTAIGISRADSQGGRSSAAAGSAPGARPQSQRHVVFADAFAGSGLDRRRWNTCHWWARHGCTIKSNHEFEWYLPSHVRVARGELKLVAERRPVRGGDGTTYPYRSGMISSGPPAGSTRAKFAFLYGRAEMRARVPAGRGLWPAFWLLPASRSSTPEIDVMEIIGQRPDAVHFHVHWRARDGTLKQLGRRWRQRELRGGWHTFAIDWRPGRLAWLVDGVVRFRVLGTMVPSTRMYLIVNLAVGGDWPGAPDSSTRFPSALQVDSVKVWR